jgi:hypothetical protein
MKKLKLILAAILILSGTAVFAQTESIQDTADNFIPDFSSDPDMKPPATAQKNFSLSYGGWLTTMYIDDKSKSDAGSVDLASSLTIAKLWLKASIPGNIVIYARGKDTYLKILNDTEDIAENDNQLELDAGYLSWTTDNKTLQLSAGRKLYNLGTGIALSDTGDGGEIGLYSRLININAFGMYTGYLDKDTNPYNLSSKDINDGAKRMFAGGTISKSIANQQIYLLGLYQKDQGDNDSDTIKTTYNSLYYGAGLEGTFLSAQYYAEYIIESGKSYLSGTDQEKDIKASAGNFGLNYYFDATLSPALLFSYSFGSGDKDRTSTIDPSGNTKGDDEGFLYFGKFVGGFALRPKLSNIHIYRAGFSINPVSYLNNRQLNRMSLIVKYSYYKKDVADGAISDTTAVVQKAYIGDAIDVSLRWKIFYDFSVFTNYGLFRPGDAYTSDQKNRTFIMAGLNLMI